MIIKWYNRDNISDVDMRQARLVADRLQGKKDNPDGITLEQLQEAYTKKAQYPQPNQIVVSHAQYQILNSLGRGDGTDRRIP